MEYYIKRFNCRQAKGALFGLLILLMAGCAGSATKNIEHGADYKYRPGYPQVRFSAVGFLDQDNKARIYIDANVVYGSLVFKKVKGKEQAKMAFDIRIVNQNDSKNIINSSHKEVTVKRKGNDILTSEKTYDYQNQIDVSPGDYKVYFTATDLSSGKKITRLSKTVIPDPNSKVINLTDIRMLVKDTDTKNPKWVPNTTYDVPGRVDSVMFKLQVSNNSSQKPLSVNANLFKFEADTSVARPMFYNNYSTSSIEYKGIDFGNKKTIKQSQRKLLKQGSVFIEFRFALQPRGDYRFAVRSDKKENVLFKARDFGVKSKNYPNIKTARELARPLAYLMDKGDYKDLISIHNQDSLKAAVDRFWLKNIGNENKARDVIKLYYNRVVEANKQFSGFKEGWKTDPGMMYILFGPPWYVEQHLDLMEWSYAYDRQDPERNFFFKQYHLGSKAYPFDHYVLNRRQFYFNILYQQRQLWLSGLILQRRI